LWTGFIVPPYTETYTFVVGVDDYAKLWLDDALLIEAIYG